MRQLICFISLFIHTLKQGVLDKAVAVLDGADNTGTMIMMMMMIIMMMMMMMMMMVKMMMMVMMMIILLRGMMVLMMIYQRQLYPLHSLFTLRA